MLVERADRPVEREGHRTGRQHWDGGSGHVEGSPVRVDEGEGGGVVDVAHAAVDGDGGGGGGRAGAGAAGGFAVARTRGHQ